MKLPGYDNWKFMTPEEDRGGDLCPFCGAYSSRSCELMEEIGGVCPWEESQPDPDYQREVELGKANREAVRSLLSSHLGISQAATRAFKPCVTVNDEARITEVTIEDAPYVAVPLFDGVHHYMDKHLALDDRRLVGFAVWMTEPPQTEGAADEEELNALEETLGALEGRHGSGSINITMKERRLFASLLRQALSRAASGEKG